MDYGLGSSYLLLKSTKKDTFPRDWRVEKGWFLVLYGVVELELTAGNETWKWSFIVDISACVIVDGLINPTELA